MLNQCFLTSLCNSLCSGYRHNTLLTLTYVINIFSNMSIPASMAPMGKLPALLNVIIVGYWLPGIKRPMWLICYYSLFCVILLFGHPARTHSSKNHQLLPQSSHFKMQVSKSNACDVKQLCNNSNVLNLVLPNKKVLNLCNSINSLFFGLRISVKFIFIMLFEGQKFNNVV